MSNQETLNIILIAGILALISCLSLTTYFLIQALKSITRLADSLEDTNQSIREKIQMKALSAIPAVLVALATKLFRRR